jgi:ApaG protein
MSSSEAVTRGIRVQVESQYSPERSSPAQHQWFFLYRVRIVNEGESKVQLVSRHWVITDANGKVEEVKAPGVVGEKPVIEPGTGFEYVSAGPLTTSFGIMQGTYQMVAGGETFDVEIAPFALGEAGDTIH